MSNVRNGYTMYYSGRCLFRHVFLQFPRHTDPLTDPYSSTLNSIAAQENQVNLDAVIGSANYDVGHVVNHRALGSGISLVQAACSPLYKAMGSTSVPAQYTALAAFEPGSGSTIMAYPPGCGSDDIQSIGSPFFHSGSYALPLVRPDHERLAHVPEARGASEQFAQPRRAIALDPTASSLPRYGSGQSRRGWRRALRGHAAQRGHERGTIRRHVSQLRGHLGRNAAHHVERRGDDQHTDLNPPGFTSSAAVGIAGGQQVGYGEHFGGHALLWSATASNVAELTASGFTVPFASGISGSQQVGSAQTAAGDTRHALLWSGPPGPVVDLHPSGMFWSAATAAKDSKSPRAPIVAHVHLEGNGLLYGADASGNVGPSVPCTAPHSLHAPASTHVQQARAHGQAPAGGHLHFPEVATVTYTLARMDLLSMLAQPPDDTFKQFQMQLAPPPDPVWNIVLPLGSDNRRGQLP